MERMTDLIPGALLQVYKGRGHVVSAEPSFARDLYEFCTWTRVQQMLDQLRPGRGGPLFEAFPYGALFFSIPGCSEHSTARDASPSGLNHA
jgi:hypothetical protein